MALVAALMNSMNYQIDKKQKQTNKPAYQSPTTVLFLLQLLLLVKLLSFFFFGGLIGCGEQVTNCHYFNQSLFTLHSLHFELSRIRLSLESFFFFHSFIGYSSCNIQYKFIIQHTKKKEKKRNLEAKIQKG